MTQNEKEKALAYIRYAIELVGDGGLNPFSNEEYILMYQFIDELSTNNEQTILK